MNKLISIVVPCYNEEENIPELYSRVTETMRNIKVDYELIFIDNASVDNTVAQLRSIATKDRRVKVIVNSRNFGHIRSPYHAILQADGDACILIAADLQDPPELIPEFLEKWNRGFKTVLAVKPSSDEPVLINSIRRLYYKLMRMVSEVQLVENATGAGLFDKVIIDQLRKIRDPYPYFRGLVCEIGFPSATVSFKQPKRYKGITKNNFFSLYDLAVLGMVKHSKLPLRVLTIFGFIISIFSFMLAIGYGVAKVLFWDAFPLGIAPLIMGVFFFIGLNILILGLVGEYVSVVLTHVRNLPHVIERERINFYTDKE